MKLGLWLSLVGGALGALALCALPWQTFELARVSARALELGVFGAVMLALALGTAGAAAWGIATGRRKPAQRAVIAGALALGLGLVVARANARMGFDLMPLESISAGVGWGVALIGAVLALGGALITRATLSAWDESSPLLRVLAIDAATRTVIEDRIVYEPETLRVRGVAVTVSPEGDASVASDGRRITVRVGERVVVRHDGIEVACAHVTPSGEADGRVATATLARSEVWAFGFAAAVVFAGAAAAPVLTWTEEAKRPDMCEAGMCPGVVAKAEPDPVTTTELPTPDAQEPEPERESKAIGGPEGKLGDPTVHEAKPTQVPRVDGPKVEHIDPRRIGLNALLDAHVSDHDALAEVLHGDTAATTSRIAAAMEGDGSVLVLGPGTGLGFQGDGAGGPGDDGPGRLLALGKLDDGPGGPGIRTSLGDPPRKKVAVLDHGPLSSNGYCKASNITSVVQRRAGAIRACYEKSLQVKATLAGKVTVRWTIGPDGGVQTASAVGDTLGDGATTRCVLDWVRRMRFEAPEGGLCVIQWPFLFSAGR